MEDGELSLRFSRGDTDAFCELILRHRAGAERLAAGILHDPLLAEDAVQEAFARIYAARERYDTCYPFTAYLNAVTKRICIDELRRMKHRPVPTDEIPEIPTDSTEEKCLAKLEAGNLFRIVSSLDQTDRRLLLGFSLEGLSVKELANETGMTTGQVRVRLHRIRKRIKERVQEE